MTEALSVEEQAARLVLVLMLRDLREVGANRGEPCGVHERPQWTCAFCLHTVLSSLDAAVERLAQENARLRSDEYLLMVEHDLSSRLRKAEALAARYKAMLEKAKAAADRAAAYLAAALAEEPEMRCEGRYPVPATRPPREEPFVVTDRCGKPQWHKGPCGP